MTNGKIAILLLSLRAGGVGLNLTTASRAFMMDPWWSPSVEDQAIDRIHRIGQNETVKVVRFIMENSIETKMLKIQDLKKQIGEAVAAEEEESVKEELKKFKFFLRNNVFYCFCVYLSITIKCFIFFMYVCIKQQLKESI